MKTYLRAALALFVLLLTASGCDGQHSAHAGTEHDHEHADAHTQASHAHDTDDLHPIRVTAFTQKLMLFMEHPPFVQSEPANPLIHLTVLATGEPVTVGTLTVNAVRPDGRTKSVTLGEPAREGIFVPTLSFETAGTWTAKVILDSPQAHDALDLTFVVHSDDDTAWHTSEESADDEPADAVPFLLEQQWKVGTLLGQVERRSLTERLQLPGEITPEHHAEIAVTTPVSGRLLPPPSGELPMVGDHVEAGEILAMVEPPLPATEAVAFRANRAQLEALDTELTLRSLDLGVRGLEIERAFQQSETRLEFAKRAFARATDVREKGGGSEKQLDQAQQDLLIAQAEYDTALAMKQFYGESAASLEQMRERLAARNTTADKAEPFQMPLIAPLSGEIVEHRSVEGEHVEALEKVFEIVNLDRVWVVARISEFDLGQLPDKPNATLELPSYPGKRLDVVGMGGRLVNIGTRVDPHTRTLPIRFEMPNPDGLLRGGMFADVYLETRHAKDALAVPESAIVLDNGRPLVYVLIDGETFQRREVELGIRDNGRVEVLAGIHASEWIATRGAYAIKLASLSPASFGHGHAH